MYRYLACFVFSICAWQSYAQQTPQYTQFIQNQYMVNPAATGVYDYIGINAGGRKQWTGIPNAPNTSYIYFSAPVDNLRKGKMKLTYGILKNRNRSVKHPTMRIGKFAQAFGGYALADQYGAYRQYKMMGTYAVHIPLGRQVSLSFGTSVGLSNRTFLAGNAEVFSVLNNTGQNDALYNSYVANSASQFTMEVEGGLYFYTKNFFLGVSSDQLTKDYVMFGNQVLNLDPRMHFRFTSGYKIQLKKNYSITPGVLVQYVRSAPISVAGMMQLGLYERYWVGLGYRYQDALMFQAGFYASNKFKMGYSFDLSVSRFFKHTYGGHELVLSLMLGRDAY